VKAYVKMSRVGWWSFHQHQRKPVFVPQAGHLRCAPAHRLQGEMLTEEVLCRFHRGDGDIEDG
jgi:hypothetical protein